MVSTDCRMMSPPEPQLALTVEMQTDRIASLLSANGKRENEPLCIRAENVFKK